MSTPNHDIPAVMRSCMRKVKITVTINYNSRGTRTPPPPTPYRDHQVQPPVCESVSSAARCVSVCTMVSVQAFALPALFLLALVVRSGQGIKCWVCSSDVDRRCGDPFNMTHMALWDCDKDKTLSPMLQSIAVCQKTRRRVNNELITVRGCNWDSDDFGVGPCSENTFRSPAYAPVEYCSTCSHEACNAADSLSATLLGLIPLLSALLVSRHFAAV
ncbi:uncharacterized protein LOC124362421 [Homalodisca vitripennis]|uniref:uncharacterized protein LOC124362421 n=1 Tax=Homalodisca vitripennis TaxID=197043 RepID=UPI001EEBD40D|nr:uncharacterized protein LOC124362421 [Homalodisca vitripennis]